jgi:hypothetical protein
VDGDVLPIIQAADALVDPVSAKAIDQKLQQIEGKIAEVKASKVKHCRMCVMAKEACTFIGDDKKGKEGPFCSDWAGPGTRVSTAWVAIDNTATQTCQMYWQLECE